MHNNQVSDILQRLEDVSNQLTLVLGALETLSTQSLETHHRVSRLEERITRIESDRPSEQVFRAPMPSLTSEERRAQTDSIRAAVDDQTQKTVPYLQRMARSSTWTPVALFLGTMAAGFVSAIFQSCGGHP